MLTIKEQMLKAISPSIAVKVQSIDGGKTTDIIANIEHSLKYTYNYETMIDRENGVIYIGKKV